MDVMAFFEEYHEHGKFEKKFPQYIFCYLNSKEMPQIIRIFKLLVWLGVYISYWQRCWIDHGSQR